MSRLIALVAVVALTAAGCTEQTAVQTNFAGTFTLQTFDGLTPPFTVDSSSSGITRETGEVLTIVAANGWVHITTAVQIDSTGASFPFADTTSGTWTSNSLGVINFQVAGLGSIGSGALSGNTLTIDDATSVAVFTRQ